MYLAIYNCTNFIVDFLTLLPGSLIHKYPIFQTIPSTNGSFDPTTQEFLYDSHVTYYCGIGRAFGTDPTDTEPQQDFGCDWTGSWIPTDEIKTCVCKLKLHSIFPKYYIQLSVLVVSPIDRWLPESWQHFQGTGSID